MEIIGYAFALLIGLLLGLVGGGGSIMAVPIFVYIFGFSPTLAITYSLFVIGITAGIGAFDFQRKKLLDFKIALLFTIPSVCSVYFTRKYILPLIPEEIFEYQNFILTKNILIMVCFSLLMISSACYMLIQKETLRKLWKQKEQSVHYQNYYLVVLEGLIVGIITGFIGAGGGFMIIPALVGFAGLTMKKAIGTSLFIISINSIVGFLTDYYLNISFNWRILLLFTFFAICGIILGSKVSDNIENASLKKSFGYFTLIIGIIIILKELFYLV